jgi:hypothetical protein
MRLQLILPRVEPSAMPMPLDSILEHSHLIRAKVVIHMFETLIQRPQKGDCRFSTMCRPFPD